MAALALIVLLACSGAARTLEYNTLKDLVRNRVDDATIINMVKSSGQPLYLSADQMVALQNAGASPALLESLTASASGGGAAQLYHTRNGGGPDAAVSEAPSDAVHYGDLNANAVVPVPAPVPLGGWGNTPPQGPEPVRPSPGPEPYPHPEPGPQPGPAPEPYPYGGPGPEQRPRAGSGLHPEPVPYPRSGSGPRPEPDFERAPEFDHEPHLPSVHLSPPVPHHEPHLQTPQPREPHLQQPQPHEPHLQGGGFRRR